MPPRSRARELALSQALADRLLSAVEEPVLLALLLGKAAQASERGIAFEIDLPDRLEATSVPARDLITIVGNLIDNALDAAAATPAPARATSRSRRRMARCASPWRDSGPGPRDGDRVFDLGVTTKEATGHGIGLALVRQTVTRLGGGIRVRGSTFEVDPAARASATAARPGRRRGALRRWRAARRCAEALRVLVVEDEPVTAEAHAAYVGRVDGFEVAGIAHAGTRRSGCCATPARAAPRRST